MNNYPKISVVTPSYNQGQFIEDTILSVLGQNYPNLEYIIMDGNSTDNTVEIIKKYSGQLFYWVSEPDSGQAEAINKGFEKSTGDILLWLNSDDMLMPNVLSYIAECVSRQGDGIYFGNAVHYQEADAGVTTRGSNVVGVCKQYTLEELDFVTQPSSFWTRNVWNQIGKLTENSHFVFDWEWFLRAKHAQINFYPLAKPISLYRIHETHKTGVGGEKRQQEIANLYKQYNKRLFLLYELILQEPDLKKSLPNKILLFMQSIYCKIKRIEPTYGFQLKLVKPIKYKEYSARDIDIVNVMR